MKKLLLIAMIILAASSLAIAQDNPVGSRASEGKGLEIFDELKNLIISVSDAMKPAVVHIEVVKKENTQRYESMGSGLVIDPKGYILTNEHVVDKYVEITVTLESNREYPAELIGVDKLTDLALIKINVPDGIILHAAPLGNSDSVQVGEWVIAVGNPYGFDRSVSFGIVSGKGRVLNVPALTPLLNDFIQTDAAIAPGSSGGPLVNLRGKVIGINSRGVGQTQGFTIPINIAIEVKNNLLASGRIERGWLGIITQPFNRSYAKYLGKPELEGILIGDILEDSPAEKAGLKIGDIILSYGDEKLSAEKDDDLNKFTLMVSQSTIGDEKTLLVFRPVKGPAYDGDGDQKKIRVKIGEQPKVKADEFETKLGFTAKEITSDMFRNYLLQTRDGVYVSFVDVGTIADKGDLAEGDVITAINSVDIKSFEQFKELFDKVSNDNYILLSVLRGKDKRLALLDKSSVRSDTTKVNIEN
jgi:serine protease Do